MALSELQVREYLAALGERTPTPASGATTAITAAFAAGLVELAGRFAGDEDAVARARALSDRLLQLADEDVEAYSAFMETRNAETRQRIIDVPVEIATLADEVAALAAHVRAELSSSVGADAEAGGELARAAAAVARRLAEVNT